MATSFGFKKNAPDKGIYLKKNGSPFIILVLYVDDILLAISNVELLTETKFILNSHFDMKDLGDASVVLGIYISCDRSRGILGLSQRGYIKKSLRGLTCILAPHVQHLFKKVTNSQNLSVLKMIMTELK